MISKKKYQAPSITSPSADFIPLGKTGGCSYGDAGASCVNGDSPQGVSTKCSLGGSVFSIINCNTGTSASAACLTGTDAILGCDTGVSVPGDCISGVTPLGGVCSVGTSV